MVDEPNLSPSSPDDDLETSESDPLLTSEPEEEEEEEGDEADFPPRRGGGGPPVLIIAISLAIGLVALWYYFYKSSAAPVDLGPPSPPPIAAKSPLPTPLPAPEAAPETASDPLEANLSAPEPDSAVTDATIEEPAVAPSKVTPNYVFSPVPPPPTDLDNGSTFGQGEADPPVDLSTDPSETLGETPSETPSEAANPLTPLDGENLPPSSLPLAIAKEPLTTDNFTVPCLGAECPPLDLTVETPDSPADKVGADNLPVNPVETDNATIEPRIPPESFVVVDSSELDPAELSAASTPPEIPLKPAVETPPTDTPTPTADPSAPTTPAEAPVDLTTESPGEAITPGDIPEDRQVEAPAAPEPPVDSPEPGPTAAPKEPKAPAKAATPPEPKAAPEVTPPAEAPAKGLDAANLSARQPAEPVAPGESPEEAAEEVEAIAPVWVSNLNSTPDEAESERIWRRLESHPSQGLLYRYDTTVGGIAQKRIRLGFFKTRKEAEEASLALAKEAGLPGSPWLVQPTVGEYNKYYRQALSNLWAVNISSAPVKEDSAKVWTALTGDKAQRALKKLGSSDQPVRLYRSETTVNGQRQYRIRLGFFATQEEAVKAGQTLATAAGLTASQIGEPWAAHPTKEEEEANK